MFIRQNSTGDIPIGPVVDVNNGATLETGLTLASADSAKARLGDGSVVDLAAYTMSATTGMNGMYDLTLQTGISGTIGIMTILIEDISLCLPVENRFFVVEETVYDALYASSSAGFSGTSSITMSEPAATTKPPNAPTPDEALMYLYWRLVYGKVTQSASEETVFRDDGSTELYTKAVTDSGGVVTYAESAAGT